MMLSRFKNCPFTGTSKRKIRKGEFAEVFAMSEQWDEISGVKPCDWYLIEGVPIISFEQGSRDQWSQDYDLDEEEVAGNEERYDEIVARLSSGEKVWPIITDENGCILDGYHRLAVLCDKLYDTVDVLWPKRKVEK